MSEIRASFQIDCPGADPTNVSVNDLEVLKEKKGRVPAVVTAYSDGRQFVTCTALDIMGLCAWLKGRDNERGNRNCAHSR